MIKPYYRHEHTATLVEVEDFGVINLAELPIRVHPDRRGLFQIHWSRTRVDGEDREVLVETGGSTGIDFGGRELGVLWQLDPVRLEYQIATFSKDLYDFLWSDEALALIPDFGWNDGGCRSLMKGFQLWLGEDRAIAYQIVKTADQQHSEHALVRVGNWFLDGDGVSERSQLIQRWVEEEGMPETCYLRPFNPSTEPLYEGEIPYYIPDTDIQKLAAMLGERFNKEEVLRLLRR